MKTKKETNKQTNANKQTNKQTNKRKERDEMIGLRVSNDARSTFAIRKL
jgi:hypothetical protein